MCKENKSKFEWLSASKAISRPTQLDHAATGW